MAIEIINSKGIAKKSGVKLLCFGKSGVGKSSIFRTTGKTLLISSESGELVLNDIDTVDIIRVKTLNELKEAYKYAKEHTDDYDTIGIDSISDIGEIIVAELKKDPEYSSMKDGIKMWMKFSDIMLGVAKSFRDLDGVNVVIIALEESVKNGFEEQIVPLIPAKKVQAKLPSLYDEVFYIKINEGGEREFITQPLGDVVAKDRSGKLDPVEKYTKENGIKIIFNKILGGNKWN